ncbi:hypothetical protein Tco_0955956 [Tanacetum coccineum]|uniref:Uncharacterized protein n=1 Tax=Tanacetum coccineum TaxID=301880 RepID=A0ABQ5E8P9_9ASTR
MSDSEDSIVSYTKVSSPFEDLSDIGSSGVDGQPMMPKDPYAYVVAAFQAPPSSDYVSGPKEPEQAPPLPDPTYPLGYKAAMIWLRAETPSTSHPLPSSIPPSGTPPLLPIPLPTPSPPLLLASTVCRAGVSEVTLPPQKRLCIALGLRYEVGESSSAPTARPTRGFRSDYRFFGTLDNEIRHDTDKIYVRLDDAQDDRLLMSGQLNMLHRDRRAHTRTTRLMETAARLSPDRDQEVASSRPQETGTACGDIDTDKDTADTGDSTLESVGTR